MVNAITIAHHHDLTSMMDEYVQDDDYAQIVTKLANDIPQENYSLKGGFLLHGSRLCITKNLREKVMYESHGPPYASHSGKQPMTQAIEAYFYWLLMLKIYITKLRSVWYVKGQVCLR